VVRGGCKGSAASEARSGGAEESRLGSASAVGKTELTSGPHVSAGGSREGVKNERREPKEKAHFCIYANGARG
jgi:hypothetical protein